MKRISDLRDYELIMDCYYLDDNYNVIDIDTGDRIDYGHYIALKTKSNKIKRLKVLPILIMAETMIKTDLNGNILEVYNTLSESVIRGENIRTVLQIANGIFPHSNGIKFKYRDIKQMNKSGKVIKVWTDLSELRTHNYDPERVLNCCQRISSSHRNYLWKFV
ncbi:MAG: hypothetical protein ACRC51_07955 [Cetobacterium sp.]